MRLLLSQFLILYFCILSSLTAQEHHFQRFTTEDGLPTNSIYGSIQDKEGYIWVYTEKGVAKFDGNTFKTFTVADGLPTNDIWDLTQDHLGRIWVHGYMNQAAYIWEDSIYTLPIEGRGLIEVINTTDGRVALVTGRHVFYYLFDGTDLIKQNCIDLTKEREKLGKRAYVQLGVIDSRPTRAFFPISDEEIYEIDCSGNLINKHATELDGLSENLIWNSSRMFYTHFHKSDYWINGKGVIKLTTNNEDISFNILRFDELNHVVPI